MALARCETHGRAEGKKGNSYAPTPYLPVGHPDSDVVCGSARCENPGLIWLDTSERTLYDQGERVFKAPSAAAKFRLAERDGRSIAAVRGVGMPRTRLSRKPRPR